jgi:hypothetical protein
MFVLNDLIDLADLYYVETKALNQAVKKIWGDSRMISCLNLLIRSS